MLDIFVKLINANAQIQAAATYNTKAIKHFYAKL